MQCVSWIFHPSTYTTFLSKATNYFSHMRLQRWEAKIRWKESSPLPGNELKTTRLWIRHAHHWATRAGHKSLWWSLYTHMTGVRTYLNAPLLRSHSFYTPEGSYYVIPPVVRLSVCPSVRPSVSNFLCAQLLLQFPSELFETCHNESPWCLVVHLGLRIWITVCVLKLSAPDFWNNTLFTLNFCPGHNFHTIKGLNFKQLILHFNSFHWQAPSGVYAPLCEALVPEGHYNFGMFWKVCCSRFYILQFRYDFCIFQKTHRSETGYI